ncbi:MAG: PaaI family thioesterase [Hyphomonadaceae bacterium]
MTFDISLMPFADTLGVEIVEASAERIVGKLLVRPELCTAGGILHGGAFMAFADTLGAVGAFLSLPAGARGTTTIESKTNFLGAAKAGTTVTGEATPVHSGKRTGVWQTKITSEDGKPVALVIQTQLVLT